MGNVCVEFQDKIKIIYERLADDLSREIFSNRLLYSLTGDYEYMMSIVRNTVEGQKVYSELQDDTRKKVIFGAGIWGKNIVNLYRNVQFECFIDNKADDSSRLYYGLPVISFEKFKENYQDELVVIASRLYHAEMYRQLVEEGIDERNIVNAGMLIDAMSERQYFDLLELSEQKTEEEVFVDGGCFDGKTSLQFLKWCDGKYKKIYAFEPDADNIVKCTNALSKICGGKFELIPKGLWDGTGELNFTAIANGSSKVSEDGKDRIQVTSLDDVIGEKVTFIKLDVEGSEKRAIRGGRNLITKYKPKLAISIYHKTEDIWELPLLIHELNPEYRFYLRHYSTAASETVLYAI